jgi:hypothetical protein
MISSDYLKEYWLEHLPFDGFPAKEDIIQCTKDLSLSTNTVKDRILNMKTNIADKLTKDNGSYTFFLFVLLRALMLYCQLDYLLLLDLVAVMKYTKNWFKW